MMPPEFVQLVQSLIRSTAFFMSTIIPLPLHFINAFPHFSPSLPENCLTETILGEPFMVQLPLAIICSKLMIETLEEGVKYFQN